MSVVSEVQEERARLLDNPAKGLGLMIPPLGEMKKGVPCFKREKHSSEPGASGHCHTAMWSLKGQQSAVPGSGCPWGREWASLAKASGVRRCGPRSRNDTPIPGRRTSVSLALAKKIRQGRG